MRQIYDHDVIRVVMDESCITQSELAMRMGYKTQSAMSQLVNRKRCSMEKVVAALNRMGCTLVVKQSGREMFEIVTDWQVEKREA